MHDKVQNIIRETLLHENTIQRIWIDVDQSVVKIEFTQPNEHYQYPDHELTLVFHNIKELVIQIENQPIAPFQELLGIECQRTENVYSATMKFGQTNKSLTRQLKIVFEDLTYQRK